MFPAIGGDAERHDETVLAICMPSSSKPTRSSASSAAVCHAASWAAVLATRRRLTALLPVPRLRIGAGTGSKLQAYRRVVTSRVAKAVTELPLQLSSTIGTSLLFGATATQPQLTFRGMPLEGPTLRHKKRGAFGRRVPALRART